MIRTAAFPVHTLTEDQAVEELGQILDSAPPEEDVVALYHWKQEHTVRAQQLEHHILRLQRAAKPETQNAPPHHLQPESQGELHEAEVFAPAAAQHPDPGGAPGAAHLEHPGGADRHGEAPARAEGAEGLPEPARREDGPQEGQAVSTPDLRTTRLARLEEMRLDYLQLVKELKENPSDQPKRNKASITKSGYRTLAKKLKVDPEELPSVPEKPAPAPKVYGNDPIEQVLDTVHEALAGIEVKVDPAMPRDQIRFDLVGEEVGSIVNIGPEVEKDGPGLTVHVDVGPLQAWSKETGEMVGDVIKKAIADQGKRDAGPYIPPTTQDLRELLTDEELATLGQVDPHASFEEVLEQLDQVAPPQAIAGTIDLVEGTTDPLQVCASLRRIRRDLLAVLPQVEDLDDRGRLVVEDDLHTLDHLLCAALNIAVERRIPKAG